MDFSVLDAYLISKPGTDASYPFGEGTRVYKVLGKMFALIGEEEDPLRLNLKCDPEDALALREQYPAILPGYHMSKRHWNSLMLDGSLPEKLIKELIDHSFLLVVKKLPRNQQALLRSMGYRG